MKEASMKELLKGQVFGWDGKKIYGYCKKCGEFTLDTVSVLCASCSLSEFLQSFNKLYNKEEEV